MNSLIANIILIILELIGLYIVWKACRWGIFIFYTQLSNIVTLASSAAFVIDRGSAFTVGLRYLSTVMLTMTVLISLSVLIPMGFSLKRMMLVGEGLIHHTLCPAISITSYILWEQHSVQWLVPVAVTFIYGVIMLCLNYKRVIEGPYPFFKVHEQSVKASVIWMTALTLLIALLSKGIVLIAH